jgi:hypothetical protein
MRRRRIIAVIAIIVCAAVVALMLLVREEPTPFSITVVRYEKELAGHVTAHVILTNTGTEAFYFSPAKAEVAILTENGWQTNGLWAFAMTSNGSPLNPGAHSFEQVRLPSGVGAWKIGYEARTPSARATLFNRLPPKLRTSAFAIDALRDWISEEEAAPQKVWSGLFDAQEWFNARAELEYLNAPLHKIFPASKSATVQTNLVRARFILPPPM